MTTRIAKQMIESPNFVAPDTLPKQSVCCFTGANAQSSYYFEVRKHSTWSMSGGSRWLYSDDQLAPDVGVQFELRYVGSIPVRVSIKSVDLETRTKIAHHLKASSRCTSSAVGILLKGTLSLDNIASSNAVNG
ncbi:src homology 2 domain-containing transforming protein C [Clonorchis sinensis]|uniref:Src homology 2 domain-containing transforming protein C n=1 Tax=Clonorchis sinensis TaxID=79923 RepID=H2KQH6_CLOSI|nr:src homology 2 domain-containing transforming protein C [Clonorchis sinensis]